MAIAGLRSGLEALGHRVETWRPEAGGYDATESIDPSGLLARRFVFNLGLRRRFPEERYDLVVGFDLDGFALPRRRPGHRIASLKGVAADELRFESGAPRIRLRIQSFLEARAARRADTIVVPSRYSLHRASSLYGLQRDRIVVVPEGINLGEWSAEPRSSPEGPSDSPARGTTGPIILSVARQYRRKNTADLLRAMPELLADHPDARLRIVGGGPELSTLGRLRADLELGGSVDLVGQVPSRGAVLREYRRAHVFCLPSLQEGFGIAFLEAMAAGLPVVACRAGAVPEVVDHGTAGLLVPPRRPDALAAALSSLLADPDRRDRMGRAGRRRARRHGWGRVARIFLTRVTARDAR